MDSEAINIVKLYTNYKTSVYEKINFEKPYKVCTYGDKCTRKHNKFHGYHSDEPEDYVKTQQILTQVLRDKQIAQAKNFTDAFLEYSKKNCESIGTSEYKFNANFNILISDPDSGLRKLNEKQTLLTETYGIPYTEDKPNFAILISIVLNLEYYKTTYSAQFMKFLCFHLDQDAFTGIFNRNGGIFLQNNYPQVFQILRDKFSVNRKRKRSISYNQIANSSVSQLFETNSDVLHNRSRSPSSESEKSKKRKKKASGLKTRKFKKSKKHKKSLKKSIRKKKNKNKNKSRIPHKK